MFVVGGGGGPRNRMEKEEGAAFTSACEKKLRPTSDYEICVF